MSAEHSNWHIIQSLAVNAIIAVAKLAAALFVGSGAMMAEAIHSFADCANQILLLIGLRQARRAPDAKHPLGYGRNVYFWSFMVALLLFTGGGVFSMYEGISKLAHPEPMEHLGWAIGILAFSLCLEGWSTYDNVKELNKRRGSKGFIKYLQDTKDSDLVVVFGENGADVLGLLVALSSILVYTLTGEERADAVGSIAVGVVLVAVSVFLAREVKSLLVGESADPAINDAAVASAQEDTRIVEVIHCITMQQGPGEVLVVIKIKCQDQLSARDVSAMINEFEARLRARRPECRWVYVEPDLQEWKAALSHSSATAATG
ncbi:MAG TPA: cation diffusion facilitator family transporter [Myxococcota bacterium]